MITPEAIRRADGFQECINIYKEAVAYLENRKGMVVSPGGEKPFWNSAEEALGKALEAAKTQEECRDICFFAGEHAKSRKRFNDLYKKANKKMKEVA